MRYRINNHMNSDYLEGSEGILVEIVRRLTKYEETDLGTRNEPDTHPPLIVRPVNGEPGEDDLTVFPDELIPSA